MSLPPDSSLEKKLNEEQLNVALYIYIGQNIRESGILTQDSYLTQMDPIVQFLLDQEIVEQGRWYKFDVLTISYRYMVELKEIVMKKLQNKKEKLLSALRLIPESILSFFVFEYLADDISFPVEKDWLFDWRDILLKNGEVKKYKRTFFKILIDHGFCVGTHSYVSTRGGELRDLEYAISAEIKNVLAEITPHMQFPHALKNLAMIYKLIYDRIEYEKRRTVEVAISEEVLMGWGNDFDATKNVLEAFLVRLNSANVLEETRLIPGWGWQLTANRAALLNFIRMDVQEQIVKPLLSEKAKVSKEEIKEVDFLRLVRVLIDRKFSVYKTAAQFAGKEIFKSLPYIERCVIDLTTPLSGEEGLRKFVNDLHQVLEESSTKEILKFREGDFTSLEEWLEIEIPSEAGSFYEDAKSFFQDLNRLRNFYSHSVDARGIFESGLIFSKLIGKYSPEKDDIVKTQVRLIQMSIRALDNLQKALEIVWQKKGTLS